MYTVYKDSPIKQYSCRYRTERPVTVVSKFLDQDHQIITQCSHTWILFRALDDSTASYGKHMFPQSLRLIQESVKFCLWRNSIFGSFLRLVTAATERPTVERQGVGLISQEIGPVSRTTDFFERIILQKN